MLRNWVNLLQQWSVVRYVLVGAGLLLLDLLVFLVCFHLAEFGVSASQVVSRTAGAAVGFVLHKRYSFSQQISGFWRLVKESGSYVVIALIGIVISPFLVEIMIEVLGGRVVIGKLMADCVLALAAYFMTKIAFRGGWRV